ncbi:MAG TPA: thiosulfate oxidation carrier complex protein SoxZ [Pseudorhodoferax sp.]|jgi:sulfur-oxidizing protein SoxZ|nr:thiosulfate oxidation carrier complex protein SoxZ [Pseudorhodoferax sp.]
MSEPMRIRAQAQGGRTQVRALLSHEMESGQRRDAAGKTIAAWFIQSLTALHEGRVVLSAQWGPAVSKNPFLQFSFQGGKPGDKLQLRWVDNRGAQRSDEAVIT